MKKLVMGSKKVFAAFMMTAMMVCTMAPLVRVGRVGAELMLQGVGV